MPCVRVKSGECAGSEFILGDAPLVVGRDDRAEIQILDQGVSRRHAEFFRVGEMYFVRDLESRNGTYVNEERIHEELLRDGDEVRIASTILLFEDVGEGGVSRMHRRKSRVRTAPHADATTTIQIDEHLARDLDDLAEPTRHEHSRDLEHLYRCSRLIGEARDPTQLCEEIAELACRAVQADHACIFLRKDSSREFELEASYQPEELALPGAPVISTRVIVEVVQTKRAILSSDEKQGPSPDPKASLLGIGRPASVIGAPLVAFDQVNGVLYAASQDPECFGSEALELITAMAVQTGIALQGLWLNQRQERVLIAAVRTLGSLLEMRDAVYTGHSARVASYVKAIASTLKVPRGEVRRLQLAALLHNVSKIVLPDETPNDESRPDVVAQRKEITEKLIRRMEGLDFVLPIVTAYHERMDGKGHPDGVEGERIPLGARILAVADRLDTLMVRGDPPEFQRLGFEEAVAAIRRESGARFDPRVVTALERAYPHGLPRRERRDSSGGG